MSKYIVVETKEEKRCVKPKRFAAAANEVDKRQLWEEDEINVQAFDKRRQEAEEDALYSWKKNRRLWRGSEVDKEMALMRERVKMRQMQEKLRLVTQPVVQTNLVEFEGNPRYAVEETDGDDSISLTQSCSDQPVEMEHIPQESYPSGTSKPNNTSMLTPPPAAASKTICSRQRMERGMASLEAILEDIIEAVKVANHFS